jgi:hypothetical protein
MKKIIASIVVLAAFQTGFCQQMIYSPVSPGAEVLLPVAGCCPSNYYY